MPTIEEGLTAAQAARLLGTHLTHLYKLLYAGKISGSKLDGKWVIDKVSVARYMANRKHNGRG